MKMIRWKGLFGMMAYRDGVYIITTLALTPNTEMVGREYLVKENDFI